MNKQTSKSSRSGRVEHHPLPHLSPFASETNKCGNGVLGVLILQRAPKSGRLRRLLLRPKSSEVRRLIWVLLSASFHMSPESGSDESLHVSLIGARHNLPEMCTSLLVLAFRDSLWAAGNPGWWDDPTSLLLAFSSTWRWRRDLEVWQTNRFFLLAMNYNKSLMRRTIAQTSEACP